MGTGGGVLGVSLHHSLGGRPLWLVYLSRRNDFEASSAAAIAGHRLHRVLGGVSGHFSLDAAWDAYFTRVNEVTVVAAHDGAPGDAQRAADAVRAALLDACGGRLADVTIPALRRHGEEVVQLTMRKAALGFGRVPGIATSRFDFSAVVISPDALADGDAATKALRAANDVTSASWAASWDAVATATRRAEALGESMRGLRVPAAYVDTSARPPASAGACARPHRAALHLLPPALLQRALAALAPPVVLAAAAAAPGDVTEGAEPATRSAGDSRDGSDAGGATDDEAAADVAAAALAAMTAGGAADSGEARGGGGGGIVTGAVLKSASARDAPPAAPPAAPTASPDGGSDADSDEDEDEAGGSYLSSLRTRGGGVRLTTGTPTRAAVGVASPPAVRSTQREVPGVASPSDVAPTPASGSPQPPSVAADGAAENPLASTASALAAPVASSTSVRVRLTCSAIETVSVAGVIVAGGGPDVATISGTVAVSAVYDGEPSTDGHAAIPFVVTLKCGASLAAVTVAAPAAAGGAAQGDALPVPLPATAAGGGPGGGPILVRVPLTLPARPAGAAPAAGAPVPVAVIAYTVAASHQPPIIRAQATCRCTLAAVPADPSAHDANTPPPLQLPQRHVFTDVQLKSLLHPSLGTLPVQGAQLLVQLPPPLAAAGTASPTALPSYGTPQSRPTAAWNAQRAQLLWSVVDNDSPLPPGATEATTARARTHCVAGQAAEFRARVPVVDGAVLTGADDAALAAAGAVRALPMQVRLTFASGSIVPIALAAAPADSDDRPAGTDGPRVAVLGVAGRLQSRLHGVYK